MPAKFHATYFRSEGLAVCYGSKTEGVLWAVIFIALPSTTPRFTYSGLLFVEYHAIMIKTIRHANSPIHKLSENATIAFLRNAREGGGTKRNDNKLKK